MARDNFVVDHLKLLWILIRWPFVVLYLLVIEPLFVYKKGKDVSKVCCFVRARDELTRTQDIVLITGSGSGIGRLTALKFADLGSTVVLWDIDTKNVEKGQCDLLTLSLTLLTHRSGRRDQGQGPEGVCVHDRPVQARGSVQAGGNGHQGGAHLALLLA